MQLIVAAKFRVDTFLLKADGKKPEVMQELQIVSDIVQEGIQKIRLITNQLYPINLELGPEAAIEELISTLRKRYAVQLTLVSSAWPDLDPNTVTNLYRMVQEALTNSAKHGNPEHREDFRIDLQVRQEPDGLHLVVEDNGVGFDPHASISLGLRSIEYRAAVIGAKVGMEKNCPDLEGGCRIHIHLPL